MTNLAATDLLFEALDSFDIQGRGTVYTGIAPFEWSGLTPRQLKGRWVRIGAERFQIKGAEDMLIPGYSIKGGDKIGILV